MKSREERTEQARVNRLRNKQLAADAKARGGYVCVAKLMQKIISKVKSRANDRRRASKWQRDNKEKVNKKNRDWAHAHLESVSSKQKRYKKENRKLMRYREKLKYHTDKGFRLRSCLRARLRYFYKRVGVKKTNGTFELVGCSPEQLHAHLLSQLPDGEKVEDYQIDHIFPLSMYSVSEKWKMTHWSNLQPLKGVDNNSKHARPPSVPDACKVPIEYWPNCAMKFYD